MKLTVRMRLFAAFGFMVLSLAALGIYSIYSLKIINNQSTIINTQWLPGVNYSNQINTMTSGYRIREYRHVAATEISEIEQMEKEMSDITQNIETYVGMYEKTIADEDNRKIVNEFKTEWSEYLDISRKVIELSRQYKEEDAMNIMRNDSKTAFDEVSGTLIKLVEYNEQGADKQDKEGNRIYGNTVKATVIVIIAISIFAIGVSVVITNGIIRPVNKLVEAADKIAVGDIDVNVVSKSKDEIGNLMVSFGRMAANIREQAMVAERIAAGDMTAEVKIKSEKDVLGKNLAEMIEKNNEVLSNISAAADQVASGSKQVSDSSIALSQGATEQASSIEQLTASIEEISSQTKQNADNASQANQLAENAKSNATKGNSQMKDMLSAMDEINESSNSISKIIKVIDEIAFQTNILALNAAVEAARAGQHGKGFAVVAEEVRNLAARSANAAKETTDMIEGSIKKVEEGTKIANQTAIALNEIVESITKVADLVGDINIASNEQSAGISQINQGIMQVSEVVQTNSATSEESAAASEELAGQAEVLREQVAKFKLRRSRQGTATMYRELEDINPEIMRVLEQMNNKKASAENNEEAVPNSRKIILSDSEFGKY